MISGSNSAVFSDRKIVQALNQHEAERFRPTGTDQSDGILIKSFFPVCDLADKLDQGMVEEWLLTTWFEVQARSAGPPAAIFIGIPTTGRLDV